MDDEILNLTASLEFTADAAIGVDGFWLDRDALLRDMQFCEFVLCNGTSELQSYHLHSYANMIHREI